MRCGGLVMLWGGAGRQDQFCDIREQAWPDMSLRVRGEGPAQIRTGGERFKASSVATTLRDRNHSFRCADDAL